MKVRPSKTRQSAARQNARDKLRRGFLAAHRWGDAEVLPLKPDASFRRYLRLRRNGAAAMLMDAPPGVESVDAFVTVTRHLEKIGARVPAIYGINSDHGFLLLEDLGDQTFTRLLAGGHDEIALYRQAIDVLGRINRHPRAAAIDLPAYDTERALAEANLLLDWYIPARCSRPVEADARAAFKQIWENLLAALPPIKPTLVLRDYHVDNLMLAGGECALLDYQDALIGSPAYDLASLLEDARRNIAPPLVDDMLKLYLQQNKDIDRRDLHRHYLVWGAQRHCKVAGIFVRLWLRDGKDAYLRHLPRVMALLRRHLHEPTLAPLRNWLDIHLGRADAPGQVWTKTPPAQLLRHCNTK